MRADRVVLDTNVFISALLQPKGPPRATVEAIRAARGVFIFSEPTLDELRTRLQRPKFDKYVSQESRARFLAQLDAVSEWVAITGARLGCRDRDDDKFLETAMMGEVDCLITGDRDLLVMSPFHDVPILSPADFLRVR